ncbi:MAG: hypothetical protein PHN19_00840 [Patescibacteria group bacterium]|nr:hypothetical protein [Patescibacteria group bacterium]
MFSNIFSKYKFASLDQIGRIMMFLFFLIVLILNLDLNNQNLFVGVDGNWQYSLKYFLFQDQKLGVDVFFTYGPLATYLYPGPIVTTSFFLSILPEIFVSLLFAFVFFLLYKITKFCFRSIILLLPFVVFLSKSDFNFFVIDTLVYLILFLLIVAIDKKNVEINYISVFFYSLFSAILLLFKFNLGIAFFTLGSLLIFLNLLESKKKLLLLFLEYLFSFCIFLLGFFYLTTGSFDILNFIFKSFSVSSLYKEYMSLNDQTLFEYVLNFILVLGFLFGFIFLRKINYAPYLLLCYFAFLYGWIRNDQHILPTLILILLIICYFIYTNLEKSKLFIIKNRTIKINVCLILALGLIIVLQMRLLFFSINLFRPDLNLNFFSLPFWKIQSGLENTQKNLQSQSEQIPRSIRKIIKKNKKCLMVLPNKSIIPVALNTCQIHLINLQLYSSYLADSDMLNRDVLKEKYPHVRILLHDEVIDYRLFFSETPMFAESIIKNFEIDKFDDGYLLLKPKYKKWHDISCNISNSSQYNLVRYKFDRSFLDNIRTFFYKGSEIYIESIDKNTNSHLVNRTYYSQLEKGIIVKPFLRDLSDFYQYLKTKNKSKSSEDFKIIYKDRGLLSNIKKEFLDCK